MMQECICFYSLLMNSMKISAFLKLGGKLGASWEQPRVNQGGLIFLVILDPHPPLISKFYLPMSNFHVISDPVLYTVGQ